MDLFFLVSCITISINRFTQKCDYFQDHSDILFLKHLMMKVKSSGNMLIVD